MRRLLSSALIGCIPLMAGCDLAPEYKAPAMAVPAAYKESGPWQSAHPSEGIPRTAWWRLYGDDTLDKLEDQIDAANPTLAAAVANYDQARAYAAIAEASLYPFLDLGGSSTRNRQSADRPLRSPNQPNRFGNNILAAQATYEIDFWGLIRNQVAAGEMSAQASAADLEVVRLSLHAELANSYVILRGLDAQAKLLQDTVESYNEALNLTRSRFEGKIASIIDVTRAQTQLSDARAAVADVLGLRAQYEHAIAALIGKAASDYTLPPAQVDLRIVAVPTGLPSTLLERRPDIAAAERRVAAANAAVGAAQAARFPVLGLSASTGFRRSQIEDLLTVPSRYWSLGPTLAATLFDAGAKKAAVGQAVGVWEQAVATYRQTVLAAFQEVEDNLAAVRVLEEAGVEQAAAVSAAAEAETIALNQYRAGTVSYLNVVTAQATHLSAQRSASDLAARRLVAAVLLAKNAGGGLGGKLPPETR